MRPPMRPMSRQAWVGMLARLGYSVMASPERYGVRSWARRCTNWASRGRVKPENMLMMSGRASASPAMTVAIFFW